MARPVVFASFSVATTALGIPRRSRVIASSTLPDVQDPQSPTPVIATPTDSAISWNISSGAETQA
jgi:hypothetical protein